MSDNYNDVIKITHIPKGHGCNLVLKEYEYQKLYTLQIWLENKSNHVDEVLPLLLIENSPLIK